MESEHKHIKEVCILRTLHSQADLGLFSKESKGVWVLLLLFLILKNQEF